MLRRSVRQRYGTAKFPISFKDTQEGVTRRLHNVCGKAEIFMCLVLSGIDAGVDVFVLAVMDLARVQTARDVLS